MTRKTGQFEPGNQAHAIHGAAAGERALSTGANFTGLAVAAEEQVRAELANDGITSIVRRDAIRLQTVADLYYAAILGADSLDKLDSLVKRFGWIAASTLRAWQQVRAEEDAAGRGLSSNDVLEAIQTARGTKTGGNDGKDTE